MLDDLTNNSNITGIANAPLELNGTYSARLKSREASRLIAAHNVSIPFFLYCAFTVVHDPSEAPVESIARYDDTVTWAHRKIMGGMVWELDCTMGTIATALKQRGMWSSTLLWFSTDSEYAKIVPVVMIVQSEKRRELRAYGTCLHTRTDGSPLSNGGNNAPLRGSKM